MRVLSTQDLVKLMAQTQKDDRHDSLGRRAGRELFSRPRAAATSDLIDLLRNDAVDLRSAAAELLGELLADHQSPPMESSTRIRVETSLLNLLEDGEDRVRASALYGLGRGCVDGRPDKVSLRVVDTIQSLLASEVVGTRLKAALAAMWFGSAVELVAGVLATRLRIEPDSGVRFVMAIALGRVGAEYEPAADSLLALLDDPDEKVRRAAADGLGELMGSAQATIQHLRRCFADASEVADVRVAAAESLVRLVTNPADAEPVLLALLESHALFPDHREIRWLSALGKMAALVPETSAGSAARARLESAAQSLDESAALVATSSLARIACSVRDDTLGRSAAARLRMALPEILAQAQEELGRADSDEYRPVLESLVDLAQWPEMQVDPSELRHIFDALLHHRVWWTREWAGKQLGRLK